MPILRAGRPGSAPLGAPTGTQLSRVSSSEVQQRPPAGPTSTKGGPIVLLVGRARWMNKWAHCGALIHHRLDDELSEPAGWPRFWPNTQPTSRTMRSLAPARPKLLVDNRQNFRVSSKLLVEFFMAESPPLAYMLLILISPLRFRRPNSFWRRF